MRIFTARGRTQWCSSHPLFGVAFGMYAVACGARVRSDAAGLSPDSGQTVLVPGDAGNTTTLSDAGNTTPDSNTACPVPASGCYECNPTGIFGSWRPDQMPGCSVTFTTSLYDSSLSEVDVTFDCESQPFDPSTPSVAVTYGQAYDVSTPYGTDTVLPITVTLLAEACGFVRANGGARVDVWGKFCSMPVMCGA